MATISRGQVRGTAEGTLAVFRGIPFAAPPVGDLRFAAPQPPRAWENVLDAEAFGPIPVQAEVPSSAVAPPPSPFDDGRGCLTVNVWTADLSGARPVMVWIYGGGYLAGSAADPGYDGAVLAQEGVVVVTFNYRVGVEGFGQLAGAPANRGLLDQVAALEWVRDNVAAFGGDPGQVTVFGQSAGAGGVAALLAMPCAAGLFHRAIAQSVLGTFVSPELAADVMATIAASAGTTATVEGLRDISLTAAVDALDIREHAGRWGAFAYGVTPFSPVVDGDVLPATPWQALRNGASRDVELIVGHTRDEFRKMLAGRGLLGRVTEEMTTGALAALAPDGYRAAFPDATPELRYETLHSDWLFRMPSVNLARDHTGRSYLYEFVLEALGSGGALGACHGADVALTFGNLTGPLVEKMLGPQPNAELTALSAAMRAAWTGFARGAGPGWGEFDAAWTTWVIGADPIVRSYPEQVSANLWAGHDFPCLPLRSSAPGREGIDS
ncbi:carboxylesterase family protein [Amycolatopsis sp. DR6-1]|uniref:Carboxylic ester hydrolase n=1 Tax=Amycolatopsis dendrobii TaxID=2760662 RepID=A0A7W3VWA6_9PSEU|nr:carboxylesterase family protein [Amycolatopsis dendrobii]